MDRANRDLRLAPVARVRDPKDKPALDRLVRMDRASRVRKLVPVVRVPARKDKANRARVRQEPMDRASRALRLAPVARVQVTKDNLALDRLVHLDRVSKPSRLLLEHRASRMPHQTDKASRLNHQQTPIHRMLPPRPTSRVRKDSPATMQRPTWQL